MHNIKYFYLLLAFILLWSISLPTTQAQNWKQDVYQLEQEFELSKNSIFLLKKKPGKSFPDKGQLNIKRFLGNGIALVQIETLPEEWDWLLSWAIYTSEQKYHSSILEWSIKNGNKHIVTIAVDKNLNEVDLRARLGKLSISLKNSQKWNTSKLWQVEVKDEQDIRKLAEQDWIYFINPYVQDEKLNKDAAGITGAAISLAPGSLGGDELSGKNVILGIGDNVMLKHVDVDDRVVQEFNPAVGSHHGIHVSVTAGGAGIKDQLNKGFAPEASLLSQYFSGILAYGPGLFDDFNMSITNNSYGANLGDCDFAGTYLETSAYLDEMALEYPKLLHIFAAGNDGAITCPPYPPGFGTTAGAYQPSKNLLTVANIGKGVNAFHISTSKGPVKDGRIKPEIAAIGRNLMSGFMNDNYGSSSGTSMASPNVSGAAALLTERYMNLNEGELPDNALLKILLMNGASDVYNFGPDYIYGFGLMDVHQSVKMLNQHRYLKDSIAMGANKVFEVTIPANVSRAKFMLYWNDLPGGSFLDPSASVLINDLDMKVTSPDATVTLPWILDPNNPDVPAVKGIDRLNNVEQITFEHPSPGNYQITVSGYNVEEGMQDFYISWDFEMDSLTLLYPIGGESFKNNDSSMVFFKAPSGSSDFTCEFSSDNGASWTASPGSISSINRKSIIKFPSSLNSTLCKVRITENSTGRTATSGTFTVSSRITVRIDSVARQCPGSVSINWTNASFAESYAIFRNIDGKMTAVDTVDASTHNYTFKGLPIDKKQWVSVAPILNGKTLIRAVAKNRIPSDGSCLGSDNPSTDLALIEILNPTNGRMLTSSALGTEEYISVRVQNRSKNPLFTLRLGFMLDEDEEEKSQMFLLYFPAGADTVLTLSSHPLNLSEPGVHQLTVYNRTSSSSEIRSNDTLRLEFEQLKNDPIIYDTGYIENFEDVVAQTFQKNHLGIPGAVKWDYKKTNGYGRLKTFVSSEISLNGKHAISMDLNNNAVGNPDSASINSLILTLNFSEIDIEAQEVRADFLYRFSGRPKFLDEQSVFLRGNDTADWIHIMTLDTASAGEIKYSNAISINDILQSNDQDFSTSLQFMIQQKDTSLICGPDHGNGLTIDSFKVYAVSNDVSIIDINNPVKHGCAYTDKEKISIAVRNNVYYELKNIPISYRLNGGSINTETIPIIPPKTTIIYTFSNNEDLSELAVYSLDTWVNLPEDSYRSNDSLLNYKIYHSQEINEFPYLQTFEEDDGNYHVDDQTSFVWGAPNQGGVFQAANGEKCWSGSLIKEDSVKAVSYLYSPCFNLSELEQPYLSFSMSGNFPFEDSSAPATSAYVEYSTDGKEWQKLGSHNTGHNWYNHETDCWATDFFPWMGVTHPIPTISGNIMFRWVFVAYPESLSSNFAIDDIHIYSASKNVKSERGETKVSANITASKEVFFDPNNDLRIAGIFSNSDLGDAEITQYNHKQALFSAANESILPTSFRNKIKSGKNYQLNLYVPHSSVKLLQETVCDECIIPNSIYHLGVSNYQSGNEAELNDQLKDNEKGNYTFYPKRDIYYKPYMDGYIVQFNTDKAGEFWFNTGGEDGEQDVAFIPIFLEGQQVNDFMAWLHWESKIEPYVQHYYLERLKEDGTYEIVFDRAQDESVLGNYTFLDQPEWFEGKATYRLKYYLHRGVTRTTNTVTLLWNKMGTFGIYPNPVNNGDLNFTWSITDLQNIEFRIVNITGALIYRQSFEPQTLRGIHVIPLGNLGIAPGNYVIEIRCGKEKLVEKFVYLK